MKSQQTELTKPFWDNLPLVLMASLTLGLAPFVPEPHIWGKLKWIAGGGNGMQAMDFFDLALHGIPWVLLLRIGIIRSLQFFKSKNQNQ